MGCPNSIMKTFKHTLTLTLKTKQQKYNYNSFIIHIKLNNNSD